MKKKRLKLKIIPILILVLIIFGLFIENVNLRSSFKNVFKSNIKTEVNLSPENFNCTRKTRLENSPQYDRALSILNQRISENVEWWEKYGNKNDATPNKFTRFPAQLTNCIKVVEKNIDNGAEGYFSIKSENIKPNYYIITIDKGYYFMDDVIISLLLTHELTHIQQTIEELQGKEKSTCIDKEVEAFMTQMDYYVILNTGEISSIVSRMETDSTNLHPQILMIKAMATINRESDCGWSTIEFGQSCRDANLRNELTKMITEDKFYQKQCGAI